MKRTLALVLALVMVIGMMAVPASAAFDDAAEIQYVEAVDVVAACGIIEGDGTGNFNPAGELTRAAGAKLVAYLELGAKAAEALTAAEAPFADVPADHWAAGYIGWAAGKGYLAGTGEGNFSPDAPLTALAYAKLMLCALGYDSAIEGYTGAGWEYNVLTDALDVDLFDGNDDADLNAVATREEAALYTFNALNAKMVKYASKGTTVEINGAVISTGATAADKTDDLLRVKRYSKLELIDDAGTADKFGRPAIKWEYDKEPVGTYTEDALAVYAGADFDDETIENDFEDWTGYETAKIVYNGGDAGLTTTELEAGRNGYTIEIYGDEEKEDIELIVVTEAYVAEIAEIYTDDDDDVTSVDVTVYEAGYVIKNNGSATVTIDVEKNEDAYALVEDYEDEDVFMVFLAPGWDKAAADKLDNFVLAVDEVESVEGEVTATSFKNHYDGWLKLDGTKYEMAYNYSQNEVKKESEGTFYLYNGFVVHFDGTAEDDDTYAYVLRVGEDKDQWGGATYVAEVVYATGETAVIEITKASFEALDGVKEGAMNYVVTVDYDEDDEIYTLAKVSSWVGAATIEKGKTKIDGAVKDNTANSETVYVIIELDDDGSFDAATAYTGYKAVKSVKAAGAWVVADGAAEYVFAIYGEDVDADSEDLIYVAKASVSGEIDDSDLGKYFTYKAVVDGEIVEIMAKAGSYEGLYDAAKVNDDGVYTALTAATKDDDYYVGTGFKKASKEVITIGDEALAYTDDVVVYVIATDGAITKGSINNNYTGANVLYTTNDDGEVTSVYVEKAE